MMSEPQLLLDVFRAVGPLYRLAAQQVARDEHIEGVSTGIRAVLDELSASGPQTVPGVARSIGTTRQYVQRMADQAEAQRLIRFTANPRSRRSPLLELTSSGRQRIDDVHRRELATLDRAAQALSDDEVDACIRVLIRLTAVLELRRAADR